MKFKSIVLAASAILITTGCNNYSFAHNITQNTESPSKRTNIIEQERLRNKAFVEGNCDCCGNTCTGKGGCECCNGNCMACINDGNCGW